jgi:16S rRNA processing protein RimM
MPTSTPEPTVVVGKVTKAHGLKGEVTILSLSDNPNRFDAGSTVFTEDGRQLIVDSSRRNGARLLVTFRGVMDRTGADALRGVTLVVPVSMLPELEPGEFWPHQLEGCEVVTESGRSLGRITDVIPNPANDIWVVVDESGTESLLPAISQVISDVDLDAERVLVKDIAGLTAPED